MRSSKIHLIEMMHGEEVQADTELDSLSQALSQRAAEHGDELPERVGLFICADGQLGLKQLDQLGLLALSGTAKDFLGCRSLVLATAGQMRSHDCSVLTSQLADHIEHVAEKFRRCRQGAECPGSSRSGLSRGCEEVCQGHRQLLPRSFHVLGASPGVVSLAAPEVIFIYLISNVYIFSVVKHDIYVM